MNIIEKNLKSVIYSDCEFFDPKVMSAEEYFNKKPSKNELERKNSLENSKVNKNERLPQINLVTGYIIEQKQDIDIHEIKPEENAEGKSVLYLKIKPDKKNKPQVSQVKDLESVHLTKSLRLDSQEINDNVILGNFTSKKDLDEVRDNKCEENKNSNILNPNKEKFLPQILPETILAKDYENLKISEQIKYDNRGFWRYFWDYMKNENPPINLFFKKSLVEVVEIRIVSLLTLLNLNFFFNATFFTDDYIDSRATNKDSRNTFWYTLVQECFKQLLAIILSTTFETILNLIISIPNETLEFFNEVLKTGDRDQIKAA